MARRWFVNDTTGRLDGVTDYDGYTIPTGVTAAVIADDATGVPPGGPSVGGNWNILTSIYTPQTGGGVGYIYDTLTDLGRKQTAATKLHDQLEIWTVDILDASHDKLRVDVDKALQFLAMAHWANYVVAQMSTVSTNQYLAWVDEIITGQSNLTNVQQYYESAHAVPADAVPQEACTWVDPFLAVTVALGSARGCINNSSNR